jgi:hypothetical protein
MALGGQSALLMAAAAQLDVPTTAFFEKHGVSPRDATKLRATVVGQTISIKALKSGALEQVYYGAQRVDARGTQTRYKIIEGAIQEEHDSAPRLLLIYDWQGHSYICLQNVGELDELGDAEGTCPYEIVATARGNHTADKTDGSPKGP